MGFDAFEKRFIDLDSSLGAKSYDRPGGIEDWIALTKAPSYTPYRHSREAWLAFLSSGWWMQAVASQRYQTIFELGSGSGEDVSALGESFVGQPRPRLRLIDISKRALRYAYEEICGQTILPADSLDILYIRADFTKHLDRALSYAEAGSKMVCMLGGTFGNFKEDELLAHMCANLSVNDCFVVGTEFYQISNGDTQADEILLGEYSSEEHKTFCSNELRYTETMAAVDRSKLNITMAKQLSSIPDTRSIVTYYNGAQNPVIQSHRYDYGHFVKYFSEHNLELVHAADASSNPFMKCIAFQKRATPA